MDDQRRRDQGMSARRAVLDDPAAGNESSALHDGR